MKGRKEDRKGKRKTGRVWEDNEITVQSKGSVEVAEASRILINYRGSITVVVLVYL